MDPVWYGCGDVPEKVASDAPSGLLVQLYEGELRGPVDCDQQIELALLGAHLGKIDVEVADRISLKLLPCWLVTINLGQPADPVTL